MMIAAVAMGPGKQVRESQDNLSAQCKLKSGGLLLIIYNTICFGILFVG